MTKPTLRTMSALERMIIQPENSDCEEGVEEMTCSEGEECIIGVVGPW